MIYRSLPTAIVALFLSVAAATGASIQDVVGLVSQSAYTDVLVNSLYTHAGNNRGYGAQHDLARTNIYNAFGGFGLNPVLSPFTYNSTTYYNVVATLPGTVNPSQVYIVGAHFDSVNNPGADDNGSGTAAVMELARILSRRRFDATIVFIGFDREEQGLKGSGAYAAAHASDDIRGMVSMDMIAYNPAGSHHDKAYIYGRTASNPIKNDLATAFAAYGNGISCEIGGDVPQSDHAPFEARGKQACLLIEHAVWDNPYYHQAADNIDTPNYIDYDYATKMTRGVAGWVATEAGMAAYVNGTWNAAGSGNWDSPANWNGGVPEFLGDSATFGSAIAAPAQVTLDGQKTVSGLTFQNLNSYSIVPGTGGGLLTLQSSGGAVPVTVAAGSHVISTAVALGSDMSVGIASNCGLSIAGEIGESSPGTSLTKTGAGRLVLQGDCSYTGPTNVEGGFLRLDGADLADGSVIDVAEGATLEVVAGTPTLGIIEGQGTTLVGGDGTILTAQTIVQSSLVIGATFTAALQATASDAVNAVPEPSSIALLGLGGIGLFAFALRRRTMESGS
jgi:autotransporter-associated beta strand protein